MHSRAFTECGKNKIVFLLLLVIEFFQATKVQLTSLQQHSNRKYENITTSLFNGPNNETLMNLTITTFVEIEKLFAVMSVRFPTSDKDTEYGNEVMKSTLEICKVFKRTTGNFIIKVFIASFKNTDSLSLECPLKPHTVRLENMDFTGILLPSYLLPGKAKFAAEMIMKAKIPEFKQVVHLHTLKFYFESV